MGLIWLTDISFNDTINFDQAKLFPKTNKCDRHNFICYSDIEFSEHLAEYPHYVTGDTGYCANCQEKVENFIAPITTLGEPVTILCDRCNDKLNNSLNTLRRDNV